MKQLIFTLIIAVVALSSCDKKYSCQCTTTIYREYYKPYKTVTIEHLPKNITKKKAKQICDNTAVQVGANADALYSDVYDVGTLCEIKE